MTARHAHRTRRWRRRTLAWLTGSFVVALAAGTVMAQTSGTIVRVEEDWQLVLTTPDANSVAPQLATVFSPTGGVNSVYAVLTINHQGLPDFLPGGLQLQVWDDESPLSYRKFPNTSVMSQSGETVRWTQSLAVADGSLTFEIINGSSTTWGSFGGQGYLKETVPTTLTDLGGYSPTVSANNSGVSYAANRVQSLILERVRLFTSTGEVIEDNTARVVHQQN